MTRIFTTDDGSHSLISEIFNETYHSTYGAIRESRHVYIAAGLHFWAQQNQRDVSILDIGFGTGLNALLTFREAERLGLTMNYLAYEAFPISIEQAKQLNYAAQLDMNPQIFYDLHQTSFSTKHPLSNFFVLEKRHATFDQILMRNAIDLIYFDAFAPEIQPELWSEKMMQLMFNALKVGGVLTTYCAKGLVRRAMQAVGFEVERINGAPPKREMLRATKKFDQ